MGKSTLFNALTGLRQHTGNWSGKTVATAVGYSQIGDCRFHLVDLPGTYSLLTHSAEEEVTCSYLCGGEAEVVVVVCDASCPDRGVALALQVMEMGHAVLLCLNLMDEARRRVAAHPADFVWIVYDGEYENSFAEGRVRVSYTGGKGPQRADDFIVDFVRMAKWLGLDAKIEVVTGDKELLKRIKKVRRDAAN